MGKYIDLLREEWKERFIWLDAGDQFQGAMENTISNGTIITDFYNIMNCLEEKNEKNRYASARI